MRTRRAFTLLELIVAMGFSAFVMIGATLIMFNTSLVLRHFEQGEPFDVHVNGVENFLTYSFVNASFPSDMDISLIGVETTQLGKIMWGMPPDSFISDDKKLCFGVMDDRPFFISRRGFSPEKVAWLEFREDDGLYLIWRFVKNENYYDFDEIPVYESLISTHVSDFEYVYIDANGQWRYEKNSKTVPVGIAEGTLPKFIRISFKYGPENFQRLVALSSAVDPLFAVSAAASSGAFSGEGSGEQTNENSRPSGGRGAPQ